MLFALFGIGNDTLNLVVNVLVLSLVVVYFALVAWTFFDARRRMSDPVLVASSVGASFVFPFIGTVIYSILRPPEFLEDAHEREVEIRAASCGSSTSPSSRARNATTRSRRHTCAVPTAARGSRTRARNAGRPSTRAGRCARTARRRSPSGAARASREAARPERGRRRPPRSRRLRRTPGGRRSPGARASRDAPRRCNRAGPRSRARAPPKRSAARRGHPTRDARGRRAPGAGRAARAEARDRPPFRQRQAGEERPRPATAS